MPTFKYTARTLQGKNITATMEADTEASVIGNLRRNGLRPLKIIQEKAGRAGGGKRRKKVKAESIVIFSRQLATMIDAGLPLVQGLAILEKQQEKDLSFKNVIRKVRENVEGGQSLSDALEKFPKVFGPMFINLVRAGESSGTLAEIMNRIAKYLEYAQSLRKKVKSAMMYPVVVSCMATLITIVLLVKVIPVFATIYDSFDAKLPTPTLALIALSNFLRHYLPLVVAFFVGCFFLLRAFYRTDKGRLSIDQAKFRIPIFGELIRKVVLSRFARTLSTLVRSGVPILRSLDIVAKTSGNYAVELAVMKAAQKIKEGESIAPPLDETKIFPPMVVRMIAVGEKTGKLDQMLEKVADFFDEQVNTTLAGLTALIEPLLIGVLGAVIGGIVICMFLPIMRLATIVKI